MIEIIDEGSNRKFMALIICGIEYGNNMYVMYSVKREKDEDNIFISKLVRNSEGYTMDNDFHGGEKEAMDDVVTSILNKDNIELLASNRIKLFHDIKIVGVNRFSVRCCYVTTYNRNLIKEVMINYGLIDIDENKTVIEEVLPEKKVFSRGSISSLFLIAFGIFTLLICCFMLYSIFSK